MEVSELADSLDLICRNLRGGDPEAWSFTLRDAAEALRRSRWISVDEQLPPLMAEVLGWHPADRVRAWFRHSGTVQGGPQEGTYWELWSPQDRECEDCDVDEPTHWMLLPHQPEENP